MINQNQATFILANQEIFTPSAAQNKIFNYQQTTEPKRSESLNPKKNIEVASNFLSVRSGDDERKIKFAQENKISDKTDSYGMKKINKNSQFHQALKNSKNRTKSGQATNLSKSDVQKLEKIDRAKSVKDPAFADSQSKNERSR